MINAITTHILDTARGVPAAGVETLLEWRADDDTTGDWLRIGTNTTDADGRIRTWLPDPAPLRPGVYRLTFQTGDYFAALGVAPVFYPVVRVEFVIPSEEPRPPYHIPLLLNPYGYSTYRGS